MKSYDRFACIHAGFRKMIATEIQENAAQYLMNTYARLPLTIERGQGCLVYDAEGREYLGRHCVVVIGNYKVIQGF